MDCSRGKFVEEGGGEGVRENMVGNNKKVWKMEGYKHDEVVWEGGPR